MPEGAHPYPRWEGRLAERNRMLTVAEGELQRVRRSTWAFLVVGFALALGLASVIELIQVARDGDTQFAHDAYLAMLGQLRWATIAIAAVVGGPMLLEDLRRGAIQLYLTRSLTLGGYLGGKALALFGLTAGSIMLPAVAYCVAGLAIAAEGLEWDRLLGAALADAALWGLMATGLALGLSLAVRSSRAAIIVLLGGFVVLHVVAANLLAPLTEDGRWAILSPFAAMDAVEAEAFGAEPTAEFPWWWGLLLVSGLTIAGWVLVWARRPRPGGDA